MAKCAFVEEGGLESSFVVGGPASSDVCPYTMKRGK